MSCYQKFYTNQIHSSSLLCQLATMWKSQVLCDAIIRTGPVITKAHRVVLVAACPMLQSMDNASMGSHLEVRLAADIKQDSINTFLQYLYEGFMMLTEENCRDVEKIARLLQVDSVIKCCADFLKCLNGATGAPMPMDSQYKYTSYDMLEFRHVRSSGLQKSVNMKRMSNFPRPTSPGSKRQRMGRPSSPLIDSHSSSHRADDTLSMAHSYRSSQPDPWERVPQLGAGTRLPTQPGVIDIVEDCLEIIQTEEPEKDARGNVKPDSRPKQKSVSIGVSSQMNTATDVHVVNISDPGGTGGPLKQTTTNGSRGSITVNPLTMFNDPSSSSQGLQRSADTSNDVQFSPRSAESEATRKENFPHAMTPPQQPVFPTMTPISRATNKPFAAGSATQVHSSESGGKKQTESEEGDQAQDQVNRVESQELSPSSSSDKAPDISIVKVEAADAHTGGLDMYVDIPEDGIMRMKTGIEDSMENEEESDPEHDQSQDALRDDISNEASNVSGDQNNSWYIGQFKGLSSGTREVELASRITPAAPGENLAVKLFREWLAASNVSQSFENFQGSELNDLLYRFYIESCNKHLDVDRLKEVRDGIFWHLSGYNSTWNHAFQDGSAFQTSNECLESLNTNSTPKVKLPHNKVPMLHEDIQMLMNSGLLTNRNPIGLFRKVWFDLAIHLGIGGQAGMRGLTVDSFVAEVDEKGRKYYRLNRKINVDKSRSCMEMQYWCWEARMYEVPEDTNCPVKTLDLYLEKRNPFKKAFFQRPKSNFSSHHGAIWFDSPVGHSSLACMMSRMSEEAGLKRIYTNSSVRYTLADLVEESGRSVEEVLGQNPRNKTSKSVIIFPPSSSTSDEHRVNSNIIHELFYGNPE
ncbi:uncharacterized protein LOC134252699 isoform X1 [Saccostrea cucullata]|uniref:uncharacterized protein LOC134252699 isoform X1 n=1 Tax=Saccostrea cuccullata TaxID=36930 RepID=UPI002ED56E89